MNKNSHDAIGYYQRFKIIINYVFNYCFNLGCFKGMSILIKTKLGIINREKLSNIKYPFFLRPKTSDISVFYQIFVCKEYEIDFSQNPKIIIDAGANIGLFAIYMKNKYHDAKIICIEPDIDNFAMLQKNIEKYGNIYCENAGIWNKNTILKIHNPDADKWGIIVEEDLKNGNIIAMSISSIMNKYSLPYVDILKIDIETSEKQLFSDDSCSEWLPKVKTVIIELHDRMQEGCSKPFFEAINKTFNKYELTIKGENIIVENI